ncbi:MAG: AAA family ATPase [Rhodospirillaceae bacterium]|nr:AAA family ATPase [Rhodospirillaceae bacterium]
MKYSYSNVDKNNLSWFKNDNSCSTLRSIALFQGSLRGLTRFEINFSYPISVISGVNDSGKSTLLAIAACAFHNRKDGYKPTGRKSTYYTFSDFFIQSREEISPDGILLQYQILHDNWRGSEAGPGWQTRRKKRGGKWNNYDTRVRRNVVYFGIQRAVPHNERSTHKSYRSQFTIDSVDEKFRAEICDISGRVLGKKYETFEMRKHSKYSLPIVKSKGVRYSGFNMGAGESAVFEILSALFEAGRGSLLVIDEIELGLHEAAQERFVDELKKLCVSLHCQIVCSTHSHVVLNRLPPEARFFAESRRNRTVITPGISAEYACRKLGRRDGTELDLFVEDNVAAAILQRGLPLRLRQRINILPIGSVTALLRIAASRYLEKRDQFMCILDGDARRRQNKNIDTVRKNIEEKFRDSKEEMIEWSDKRIKYLPSNDNPEKWLLKACRDIDVKSQLINVWQLEESGDVASLIEAALLEEDHNEFFFLENEIQCDRTQILNDMVTFVVQNNNTVFDELTSSIHEMLEN